MNEKSIDKSSAGKGDSPRNCFSKKFRDNYDLINWSKKHTLSNEEQEYINKIKDELLLYIPSTTPIID